MNVGNITQLTDSTGRNYPLLDEQREWVFMPQEDYAKGKLLGEALARVAELEEQVRQLPQRMIDAIEQYDWQDDDGAWFLPTVRAIITGEAGYPCDDDSLWFTGAEWQGLLDKAIGYECATRDQRIAELETVLRWIEQYAQNSGIHPMDRVVAIYAKAQMALAQETGK